MNKGARKIKIEELKSLVEKVEYKLIENTTLTICVLHIVGGFTVTGTSGTIDPSGFDKEMGEKIAYNNAFDQLWMLEGYFRIRFLDEVRFKTFESINQTFDNYSV